MTHIRLIKMSHSTFGSKQFYCCWRRKDCWRKVSL